MSDWSSDVCSSDLLLRVRAVVVQWVTDLASRVCRVLGTGCRNVFVRPGTYAGTGWVRFEVATAPRDLDKCRRQTITMSSAVRGGSSSSPGPGGGPWPAQRAEIGRAHGCTPGTNAKL